MKKEEITKYTIEEFEKALLDYNEAGRKSVLKHREMFPPPKPGEKKPEVKGGRRFHASGTDAKCAYCKPVIQAHNKIMALQKEQLEFTGIPIDNIMAAIKVTRATIRMMKNSGEL